MSLVNSYNYISASNGSGHVFSSAGFLTGFNVNSSNNGVITLYDYVGSANGSTVINNYTPSTGFNYLGTKFSVGCFCKLNSGSINMTWLIKNSD
jgi:hypothetical protein